MGNHEKLQNSIDVLQVTLNGLLRKHSEAKLELARGKAVMIQLKSENELLTKSIKDLALKLSAADDVKKKEESKDA